MPQNLLPTSLVGSYAQPDWLIDRKKLAGRFPPRVRAKELWRVAPEFLDQAQDDATLLAIREQERAGLDIITDGEIRRESYSNRFATALEGVDIDNPGTAFDRSGHPNPVPRITGKVRRKQPIEVREVEFLRKKPQSFTCGRKAIRSCLSSPTRRCSRSRLKRRNPNSTARCWRSCRARLSSSVCSISLT